MKRNVLLLAAVGILVVCAVLFPLQWDGTDKTKERYASFHQRIIIRDSVGEPLSPHVKQAGAMETTSEPQLLPNVDLNHSIVITKMPHIEKTRKN
ncbi:MULTISPECIES: hypothetical protein [Geobacillus]|uniref:Uncharacterized protein n=1 Tax=Geobacillus zalihae TaxID=213419 RepID=A0A1V9CPS1_9BACL|nr:MULTISPECIES: hypothetical protein [Geobacillus]AGE21023.1 hypothetical protein GHH_c04580 [Geobacillus sp. GHH01]EPR28709.1 hypothetical protein I656_01625 [Geobacillus sp. WSUCF1]OQP16573.1 hypothetical protein B1693_07590 [Geobacillus zalihae]OQP23414.1 hypothetical protein B1694_08800 [Geobacillus zalihae]QNU17815.1 hypothetical protein IC807_15930 [Geobacillus zalihae]